MNSCELVSLVTAVSLGIAKSVPPEDLPEIAAIFSQIATTLGTIIINEELLHPKKTNQEITPEIVAPDAEITNEPPV